MALLALRRASSRVVACMCFSLNFDNASAPSVSLIMRMQWAWDESRLANVPVVCKIASYTINYCVTNIPPTQETVYETLPKKLRGKSEHSLLN